MSAEQLRSWEVASTPPGECVGPSDLDPALTWLPAQCPGTVASALREHGLWCDDLDHGHDDDFDARDWWFRTRFDSPADASSVLRFGGIATIADVWVGGVHVLHSENMFVAHEVDVPQRGADPVDIVVVCRSLTSWLSARRPRGRWKTRLVEHQQLRWARTTLLGRMPTWPPRAAPVGLWRPVELETGAPEVLTDIRLVSRHDGESGVVSVTGRSALHQMPAGARLRIGDQRSTLIVAADDDGGWTVTGTLVVDRPSLWWPNTHGDPTLYDVVVDVDRADGTTLVIPAGRVGFRSVDVESSEGGFGLVVNGVPVFCRGACWVPVDPVALSTTREALGQAVRQLVDAGMNMVRLTGTMVYEEPDFYDVCDELGVLVWHDLMFANMDYPIDDVAFAASVTTEVEQFLVRTRTHPCLAVVCGGSEVEQQAAMMGSDVSGLDHRLGREVLRQAVETLAPDVGYVPNSPSGGVFPFSISSGVSHYYGVGAYRRPLDDARRANVRFTTECLAFANVPCREVVAAFTDRGDRPGHSPRWKYGVPRDRSAGWDFEDIRDHYVRDIFGVDPFEVRAADPDRYLDLGRAAVSVAIETSLGEWRRAGSSCAGALLFTARDLTLGAGWGLIDSTGAPKSAYYAAARACSPVGVSLSDEGLDGLAAHLSNDRAATLAGALVARMFASDGFEIASITLPVQLAPRESRSVSIDGLFGGFRDITDAYRFGPRTLDVVSVQLLDDHGEVVSEAFFLPGGHARALDTDRGLVGDCFALDDGLVNLDLRAERFAHFVSIDMDGYDADANWFHLAPGDRRTVTMTPRWGHGVARRCPDLQIRSLDSRRVLVLRVPNGAGRAA